MKTTAERLNYIMSLRNLRQVDILRLAEPFCQKYLVKLTKSDLSQFVTGKVIPGQFKLKILSLALNVNEAWLMGHEDVPMDPSVSPSDVVSIPPFDPSIMQNLRQEHGFSPLEVSSRSGIPYDVYISFEQGKQAPDIYQLQAISHALFTTPSRLLNYFGNFSFLDTTSLSKGERVSLLRHMLLSLDESELSEVLSGFPSRADI